MPFYEGQVSILTPLTEHNLTDVRQWARRLIDGALRQAKLESERDEEHEIGRYS